MVLTFNVYNVLIFEQTPTNCDFFRNFQGTINFDVVWCGNQSLKGGFFEKTEHSCFQ